MVFNTSTMTYTIAIVLGVSFFSVGCGQEPTPMPTEELIAQQETLDPAYQLIYGSQASTTPSATQQRVRILLWLKRMNCNVSQLQKLDELRLVAQEKVNNLKQIADADQQRLEEIYTPIFNQLWDKMRIGVELSDTEMESLLSELKDIQRAKEDKPLLDPKLETIKSIIEAEETFLRSLSPEQESTIVDALYFLRHHLDPVGSPKDFSLLIGNTFEPGQYAILLKGTSELAQQSGNIGGLWSDEPELTGRVLHEAKREVVLYLILLEPALEEAIRAAIALQSQSASP